MSKRPLYGNVTYQLVMHLRRLGLISLATLIVAQSFIAQHTVWLDEN